jgi:hypothetical protein
VSQDPDTEILNLKETPWMHAHSWRRDLPIECADCGENTQVGVQQTVPVGARVGQCDCGGVLVRVGAS